MRTGLRCVGLLIGAAFRADAPRAALVLCLAPVVGACRVAGGLAVARAADAAIRHDRGAALAAAALLLAAVVVTYSASAALATLRIRLQQRVGLLLDQRLMTITCGAPTLTHHEHPEYLDRMELLRANRGQLGGAFGALVENLRSLVALGSTVALLATVHPALLLLPLCAIPAVFTSQWGGRLVGRAERHTAEPERLRRSLFELACDPRAGRELRVYRLGPELVRRHDSIQDGVDRIRNRADVLDGLWSTMGWLVFGAGYLGAVLLSLVSVSRGHGSPGDVVLTVLFGAQLLGGVSGAVTLGAWLRHALRAAGYLLWLTDRVRPAPDSPDAAPVPGGGELVFDRVSFAYPGTDRPVLREVSLRVPAGATLAIVGENGAGKTTLAKLLCRMYEPTAGTISYGGVGLAALDVAAWRRGQSACFQDFQRFEFTLRTAVGLGDLSSMDHPDAITAALLRGGAERLPPGLPRGLDTQLGTALPGGVELSTGQWQKVAMSRAMMRRQPLLLILDEPTASLDAAAEHELFASQADAARGNRQRPITVLVSHRFATVRAADLIVVLRDGRIHESGTHRQLIELNGLYAELYALSARGFAPAEGQQLADRPG